MVFCLSAATGFSQNIIEQRDIRAVKETVEDEQAKEGLVEEEKVFDVVENAPSFPGGQGALMSWLRDNMKYPAAAAKNGVEGRVIVQFVVGKDGSVSNVRVVKGVDPVLDKEAVRVMSAMPRWTPGMSGGRAVSVRYTLPVTFRL